MTANKNDYSLSFSSLESSSHLKMSNQVVRLRDYKELHNQPKNLLSSLTPSSQPTLSSYFMKKLFTENLVFEEIEQLQYCAAELQGQLKEIRTNFQLFPSEVFRSSVAPSLV